MSTNTPSFLQIVAQDLLDTYGNNMARLTVVFPNKRASLFLNQELARLAQKPIWSPAYTTISDLFRKHSQLKVADNLKLICDLHKSFNLCTGGSETLDHFWGWGQQLLSDFDDIDKSMAEADRVFANLRDIHEMDSVDFLTEDQRQIISHFFKNFSTDHDTLLKQRFLTLWSHFSDIYAHFNNQLTEQGIAYEGSLYRSVVTDKNIDFGTNKYIFVGFNVLQRVEQRLFDLLTNRQQAKVYWDEDLSETKFASQHPSSITILNAPTENAQARYVYDWLTENPQRVTAGKRTAIVLCDESLLPTVIRSLPPTVSKVNITTGYPLSQTPIALLLHQLLALQTMGLQNGKGESGNRKFRQTYVNRVLHHPYAKFISPMATKLARQLADEHRYYPKASDLTLDEGLSLLFGEVVETNENGHPTPLSLTNWLMALVQRLATHGTSSLDSLQDKKERANTPLFQESVFRTYTLLNRLRTLMHSGDLLIDIITYQRLLRQIIESTTIPFHGEPAEGLQIMGVLETRNLDFDHLLLLSANEGNMPRGIDAASFIPNAIRFAFGLTTIDKRADIYRHYFFSLIHRAKDTTLAYNSSTTDGKTGEMSRFMLQLMANHSLSINRVTLMAGQLPVTRRPAPISKDDLTLNRLNNLHQISPTALNRYLRCPLQFFYSYILNLKEPTQTDEGQVDSRMFGNIFHAASETIYKKFIPNGSSAIIHESDIDYILKHKEIVERAVDEAFSQELHQASPQLTTGLQLINREVIIYYLRQLLTIDRRLTPFSIVGLESDVFCQFSIETSKGTHSLTVGGRIDRIDEINKPPHGRRIRIVDYKTGARQQQNLNDVEAVFSPDNVGKHSDYYLQAMLYSLLYARSSDTNPEQLPVSPALLFIQHASGADYDPTLQLAGQPITDIAAYDKEFRDALKSLLTEIFEPSIPFCPTNDQSRCTNCPYKNLCGEIRDPSSLGLCRGQEKVG